MVEVNRKLLVLAFTVGLLKPASFSTYLRTKPS
jgi:hypothetical protein